MVMKRYPHGAAGEFFFMKRAPSPRPEWIELCSIEHGSGNVIDFPIVQDLAALLWVINLGCIDLNQWYARCDDVDRPDYLHFDLDPVPGADFRTVIDTASVSVVSLYKGSPHVHLVNDTGGLDRFGPAGTPPPTHSTAKKARSLSRRGARLENARVAGNLESRVLQMNAQ